MSNPSLTPDQIYEFLDLGYLEIQLHDSSYGKDFAARMFQRAREAYKNSDLVENQRDRIQQIADETVDSLPEVKRLLSSRELKGALTSLLGEGFYRYRHSFIHRADKFDQSFHKDSPLPWGTNGGIRSHKPEWAMVFYYPQDTMLELGPTEILPGTQYWNVDRLGTGNTHGEDRLSLQFEREKVGFSPDLALRDQHLASQWQSLDENAKPTKIEASAGTLVLIHFDLFHRATRMICDGERYMYKFWFTRTSEPKPPKKSSNVRYRVRDMRRKPIVDSIVNWMGIGETAAFVRGELDNAICGLNETKEPNRIFNAYLRAKSDDVSLISEACSGIESIRRAAVYALATVPNLANRAIIELEKSQDANDRQCAAFLIGESCSITHSMIGKVIELSYDVEPAVSRAAIIAIGKIKRRQTHPIETEAHDKLVDSLLEALEAVAKDASHRQLVYLSLLCFASDTHNPLSIEQVERIAQLLKVESNPYARKTGEEVLDRAVVLDSVQTVNLHNVQLESETSLHTSH